jgi:hypothetical protein
MKCMVAQTLADRLSRRLAGPEQADLAAHLETDCPDCDAAIAAMGPDRFGELLAARVQRLEPLPVPSPGQEERDAAFGRVMAAVARPARRRFGLRWLVPALTGACALIVAGIVALPVWIGGEGTGLAPPDPPGRREKGDPGAPALDVWFDVAGVEDGRNVVKARGEDGQACTGADFLVLRYRLGSPAFLYVIREDASGRRERVYASEGPEPAGIGGLLVDGKPAAYPLKGISGRQKFLFVASPDPIPDPWTNAGLPRDGVAQQSFAVVVEEGRR